MKNQYVGDVGDYGKYGMLRFLAKGDIRIGVNWYLTADDGGNDGKKTEYLNRDEFRRCDEWLFDFLKDAAFAPDKSVRMIEDAQAIPGALYYHEPIDVSDRAAWHRKGLKALAGAELVFCDPDNGTLGKKGIRSANAEKYISPHEVVDYYEQGQNIVYYCQRARRNDAAWMETKLEMAKLLPDAKLYVMTYHRGTQRSYIFVLHPEDFRRYGDLLQEFEKTPWGRSGNFTREFSSLD